MGSRTQVLLVLLVALVFLVPQISQQLVHSQLPITGDLVHLRISYLFSNFPNYSDAPALILSHSEFYHRLVSYLNIVTGLTGEATAYGLAVVNMLFFPIAALILYVLARRIVPRWAFVAPLLFFLNPNLVLPFFGHANQFLIYTFLGLFLFLVLFLKPTRGAKVAALLTLGVVLNSSITIWLPLALIMFVLERFRPDFEPLLLLCGAALANLLFLTVPIQYLAFGDPSGVPKLLLPLAGTLVVAIVLLQLSKRWKRRAAWLHSTVLPWAGVLLVLAFFLIPRSSGPFSSNVRTEDYLALKEAATAPVNLENFFFSINPSEGFDGFTTFTGVVFLLTTFAAVWFWRRRRERTPEIRTLFVVTAIPVALAILSLVVRYLSYDLFVRTPLWNLHIGRILSMSLYLLPLLLIPALPWIRRQVSYALPALLLVVALIGATAVSVFAAQRVNPDWTQRSYEQYLQTSLEEGRGSELSGAEALYSCRFYDHCSLTPAVDARF